MGGKKDMRNKGAQVMKENVTQEKSNDVNMDKSPSKVEKIWKVSKENVNEIRKSTNNYVVLADEDNVDSMERMENEDSEEDDVFESHNQALNSLIADEVVLNGAEDEIKLLHYKVKIKWLKEGNIVNLKLTPEEAEEMIREVTNEEIKSTLFYIDLSKAACPYRYSACFYKKSWQIVGKEICMAIREFFSSERKGFFKGGRRLRQGDPISPYLFTIVMEVFNMIMIKNVNEAAHFKYHYGCSNLKLTHMCFADDLLVLCNGDIESLRVVKKSLDEFSRVSGLYPNLSKSTIVFGNVPNNEKVDMLQILSFKCGTSM
ncbi:RNA-directed DNA polymerase, eukaryota, reverse transcriptase zinc-binding domain protein [Tanacetum coccineum]